MYHSWPKRKELYEIAQIDTSEMQRRASEYPEAAVSTVEVPTFFGTFALDATPFGVASLFFPEFDDYDLATRHSYYGMVLASWGRKMSVEAGIELMGYAVGEVRSFETPVDLSYLTSFQQDVLHALREVPFGETITYSQLAASSGHPRKIAPVVNVVKHNPLPIFVPCHRVLPGSGTTLGVTNAPLGWKAFLLSHEGHDINEAYA